MEIRKIELNGQVFEYQLNIKQIKRCYLKVVAGKIIVNSGPYFSINEIEQLIKDNQDAVLKQIDNYLIKYDYSNGGFVYIFNQCYQIISYDLNNRKTVFHDDKIYVYHRQIQTTIEITLKIILKKYIEKRIQEYLKQAFILPMPAVEIKKYKSRWGACYPKINKVSFNLALVHLNYELIDYVIVHELCHFLQPNHSKQFYQEIKKRLPNYKQCEKKLKEIGI